VIAVVMMKSTERASIYIILRIQRRLCVVTAYETEAGTIPVRIVEGVSTPTTMIILKLMGTMYVLVASTTLVGISLVMSVAKTSGIVRGTTMRRPELICVQAATIK
jgi:hypothetical protein